MRGHLYLILQFVAVGMYVGCANVHFEQSDAPSCDAISSAYGSGSCQVSADGRTFNYTVKTGEVDLLVVDDDSGSMYTEQEKMANQFPGFLDSLSDYSYQIAITSTDVENSGPGSDGRFFEFAPGQSILKNNSRLRDSTHYANIAKFQSTVKRQETLTCPNGISCPSGDERAIYALNRALARTENASFFRPGGHLAIVILSDEDERSSGGGAPGSEVNGGALSASYAAQSGDLPATFVSNARARLPSDKSFSVHSIIIRPGDAACWTAQNSQGGSVKGYYGAQYAILSSPAAWLKTLGNLVDGTQGSICSANYTQEMGNIAANIRSANLQLPCAPNKNSLRVGFSPAPSALTTFDLDGTNRLNFKPALPAGTAVHLQFTCPNS